MRVNKFINQRIFERTKRNFTRRFNFLQMSRRGIMDNLSKQEISSMEDYWYLREKKLTAQAEKAETTIFNSCVFYILGFVGRGEDSRLRLSKEIERNGGKTTLVITSHTTHVISRNLCHSKRTNLDKSIEKRNLIIVAPEYIGECINQGRLVDPAPFITVKPKTKPITNFFPKE